MATIGIDLGTTNSLGAVYRNGGVELIPNQYGSFLTPSVISIDEKNNILVGQVAKERLISHPELTASSFKKDMGIDRKYQLGKKTFLPEELSSFVIRSILDDAKVYLNEEIEEVVISVPAYFHDKQRVATKKAGILAGVNVKRIINEPSAAALVSYYDTSSEQVFLVFDFGGGTLDISIVECFDTMVEILSVSGDNRLGGDNFHEIMAEGFLREHRLTRREIIKKEYAILIRQAENCKRKLTEEGSAKMSAVIGGKTYQSEYTNKRLIEESGSILARIKKVLTHALRDGDLTLQEIDAVVMVGGSSKMPIIQSFLQHILKQIPVVEITGCDEMIARGLGLICAVKERQEEIKDFVLTDICPFTLGTGTKNEADPNNPYMHPIIPRNTMLPCSRVERLYTAEDNQISMTISILQGEQIYAKDNLELGEITIIVPERKEGEESADVRFTYDINGILIADVTVVSTGEKVSKVVSQNMSEADLSRKIHELEKLKVHPKDFSGNRLIMEKLYSLYEEVPTYLRDQISKYIRSFELLLAKQNPRSIKKYRSFLEQIINQLEMKDPFEQKIFFEDYEEEDWEDEKESEEKFDFFNKKNGGNEWIN